MDGPSPCRALSFHPFLSKLRVASGGSCSCTVPCVHVGFLFLREDKARFSLRPRMDVNSRMPIVVRVRFHRSFAIARGGTSHWHSFASLGHARVVRRCRLD